MMGEVEILATLLSLKVAAVAVLGSLPLALLVATRLARGGRGTLLLDALVHLPLVLPPVVTGYLLLLAFGLTALTLRRGRNSRRTQSGDALRRG